MDELYLGGIGFIDAIFLPLFYILTFLTTFVATDLTGVLDGLVIVVAWLGFIHDPDIFPLYLTASLDILFFSWLVAGFLRLIFWIKNMIPFV